jgi:sigma-B regulation protein RsbU (phosphoserine phosphatase)
MHIIDGEINEHNPLRYTSVFQTDSAKFRAYCVVFDRKGTYIYHPEKQRIFNGNFFDDTSQLSESFFSKIAAGITAGQIGRKPIMINGDLYYIFYDKVENTDWTNAVIMSMDALKYPSGIIVLIFLIVIMLGQVVTYWVSRITIHRSTKPLQHLAKSADEVALGNFQAPLPELKYNDEISHLRDSFGNMQQSLTLYIDRLKTTTARNAAIENELSIARNIQLSMVPTVFPDRNDIDVYGSMTTAKAVGGDLYDFFVRDDQLFFCIGDVSGKGIPAALLMMETKSLFRAYAKGESMPDRIVSEMNHDLSENNEDCLFVTLFVGILDLTSGLLRYCNAGHEIPFLINKEVRLLPLRPITPIGIDADTPYQTQTFALEPDTIILLFTDGLNEAMDADSKEFGRERILEEASRSILAGQLSSKALIERLTQAVHDFVGDTEQSDDLTMLAIRLR